MIKVVTLFLALIFTASLASAQDVRSPGYAAFLRKAMKAQRAAARAASGQKTNAIKERIIGSSSYDYSAPPTVKLGDSIRYKYNGNLSFSPSIGDDFQIISYYDNTYFFVRLGREDPADESIFYDTAWSIAPLNTGPNVITQNIKQRDAAGYLTTYTVKYLGLSSGIISKQMQWTYTYDAAHNCTRILESKDTSTMFTGAYKPVWMNTSIYISGQLTMDSSYDFAAGAPDTKSMYSYSSGNLVLATEQSWSGGAWFNFTRETATYDASGRVLTSYGEMWRSGAYAPDERDSFKYTGSWPLFTFSFSWVHNTAYTALRNQGTFNIKLTSWGGLDSETISRYDVTGTTLSPVARYKCIYNASKNMTSQLNYNYTAGAWSTTPVAKTTHYYQSYNDATGVPTSISRAPSGVRLFPLPAWGEVRLMFDDMPGDAPQIAVFDMSGKRVLHTSIPKALEGVLNTERLAAGVYNLQVKWPEHCASLKMVKE